MTRGFLLFVACLALLPAGPPAARAEAPPVMAAVGLIYNKLPAGCSASLIAPDEVLTAAHCVPDRGDAGAAARYAFRTGAYTAHLSVDTPVHDITVHPLYDLDAPSVPDRISGDLALVRLANPVPASVATPIRTGGTVRVGDRLLVASWRGEKSLRARERTCPVLEVGPQVITLGCEANPGESGAPVLRLGEGGPELVAVVTRRMEVGPQKLALAAPIGSRIGQLRALLLPR